MPLGHHLENYGNLLSQEGRLTKYGKETFRIWPCNK